MYLLHLLNNKNAEIVAKIGILYGLSKWFSLRLFLEVIYPGVDAFAKWYEQ
jgi:hypothetical protein